MWDNATAMHLAICDYELPAAPADASHDGYRFGAVLTEPNR